VIWHRFVTSEDDNGMEDPSVHLLARIEYDPEGNSYASREALESASLKISWKPVYKNAIFEDSDDEGAYDPRTDSIVSPNLTEHFDNLEIPVGSTIKVIRNAFHKLALSNHPDKGGDEEMFKRIKNSYEILCDNIIIDDESRADDDHDVHIVKPHPVTTCGCGKKDVQVVKGGFLDGRHARRCAKAASFNDEIRQKSMKSSSDKKGSKKAFSAEKMSVCVTCHQPGALFCCDGCPRSFCIPCYGGSEPPSEVPWYCGKCSETISPEAHGANEAFKHMTESMASKSLNIDDENEKTPTSKSPSVSASSAATLGEQERALHFPSEAAGGTRTTDNSEDSTTADSSAVCLTFCEDAAAGAHDLGQNAISPLQAFRPEHIAEKAGLHDRRGKKRAVDDQSDRTSDRPSPRKKAFVHEEVREEYNEEMIFRRLWEDFKSEIFSESRLYRAIVALQAVIIVSEENGDFDNAVKYETMMIQIEEARAKKDGGLALRNHKFKRKN